MSQNIVLPVRKDIFMIIDELRKIVESSNMIKEQNVPERVCEFIETFLKRRFVPVEYAEKLLSIVANIVEKAETEGSLDMFAQDQHFLLLLIQIIDAFSKNNTTASVLMNSFRSHYCYELVLFILLGFVEKTKTLSIFVNTVLNVDDLMKSLLQALNKLVMHDELYLTQVSGDVSLYCFIYIVNFIILNRKWV